MTTTTPNARHFSTTTLTARGCQSHTNSEPLLSAEEEVGLAQRVKAGDKSARERMVLANQRLVVHIARAFATAYRQDMDDMIAAGNVGLLRAVDAFEPERGLRFGALAGVWIKGMMKRELRKGLREAQASDESELMDNRHGLPGEALERREACGRLAEALDGLPAREALVVRKLFGMGVDVLDGEQLGNELGLTRARVSQLKLKALAALRATLEEGM